MTSRLCIELLAAPSAVPGARRAVSRLCEHLGLGRELSDRIRLAATEACTNCVRHAYAAGDGALEPTFALEARVEDGVLELVVRDYGRGMARGPASRADTLHLGIGLIEALADSACISSRPGRGTRVSMRFALAPGA